MNVKELQLFNYRNYKEQRITFGEGINIFYGQNAQGKTNILEALYISSTGKSHRTNNYNELVNHEALGFEINLLSNISHRDTTIVIKYSKAKGKHAEINGVKRDKLSDILGTLNMILFSPETLDVVKGAPGVRRKFLDILLCQIDRNYLYLLKRYNLLIRNKSIALKQGRDKKYKDIIPIWNEQISEYGGKIAFIRNRTITELNIFMNREIEGITKGTETSELVYKTFCSFEDGVDEKYFTEELSKKLIKGLERETEIGQCLYGTHRDDFEILLNGMNSRQYCSQGQQRTLALTLILAELFFVENIKEEKPVLLLDDVMSELDQTRQEYLLRGLRDVQTIITTTDELPYSSIKGSDINRFYVERGTINPNVDHNLKLE